MQEHLVPLTTELSPLFQYYVTKLIIFYYIYSLERTKMSHNRRMHTENVVHLQNGILLSYFLFPETGFLCVVLVVLELTL